MNAEHSWTTSFGYRTNVGNSVLVLRRDLSIAADDLRKDLEPFFELQTLAQFADRRGIEAPVLGRLEGLEEANDTSLRVFFAGLPRERILGDVRLRQLTVWRVDDVLDMLQVTLAGPEAALYLQTGGAAILRLLEHLDPLIPGSPNARDIFLEHVGRLRALGQ